MNFDCFNRGLTSLCSHLPPLQSLDSFKSVDLRANCDCPNLVRTFYHVLTNPCASRLRLQEIFMNCGCAETALKLQRERRMKQAASSRARRRTHLPSASTDAEIKYRIRTSHDLETISRWLMHKQRPTARPTRLTSRIPIYNPRTRSRRAGGQQVSIP